MGKQEVMLKKHKKPERTWQLPGKGCEDIANCKNAHRRGWDDAAVDSGDFDPDEAGIAIENGEECSQRGRDLDSLLTPNSIPVAPKPIDIVEPKRAG